MAHLKAQVNAPCALGVAVGTCIAAEVVLGEFVI